MASSTGNGTASDPPTTDPTTSATEQTTSATNQTTSATDQTTSSLPHHDNNQGHGHDHEHPFPDAFTQHLHANKSWASSLPTSHPELLPALSKGQAPAILWIGCSDSRVPETTLLGGKPGDVFVHRNIANVLHAGDISAAAVITYAVVHLKVKHVVLCGHTLCGGANAALGNARLGLLDTWLLPLRALRRDLARADKDWASLSAADQGLRLVEANVRRGVAILRENADIIEAAKGRGLKVHGCVYDVATAELKELDCEEKEGEEDLRVGAFGMDQ